MNSFPESEHYERGYREGLEYGRSIGFQDMLKEGKLHGQDLGHLLGQVYVDMSALKDRLPDEKKKQQIEALLAQVLEYPLDNEIGEGKEEGLERIKRKHKEYSLIYGMELLCDDSLDNKKSLEF